MLGISVEFLLGTYRADPDGTAATGALERGEWPPAPARLFAAFVAADGTGERCRVTDGSELAWLEALPPPEIHAGGEVWHQRLDPRYVARHGGAAARGAHQEYVGRRGVMVRPGVRVTSRDPRVMYVWDVAAPADVLGALRRRAARIGYLGAADSPARVRVTADPAPSGPAAFVPDPDGDLAVTVPGVGDLETLDAMFRAWRLHGAAVSRQWFPTLGRAVRYRSPATGPAVDAGSVVAWLRLEPPLPGRRIGALTAAFKAAILSRYQRHHGEPPPVLHGHGFDGPGYDLARFLALPDVGHARARGRIHGLALWLPPGADPDVRIQTRDAALAVRELAGPGIAAAVTVRETFGGPWASSPGRWRGPSSRWVTAFPAIHERHGPLTLAEVARWCRHAGLPAPVAFRATRGPLVRGAADLAPVEVNRPGRGAGRPYSHIELLFDRPVTGPVVVGAGRQRGFGLCVPVKAPP